MTSPRDHGGASAGGKPAVTPDIAAEAAVWIARLHGPSRCRQMELDCLAWQAKSAAHRHAFERCTDTWEAAAGITVADVLAAMATQQRAAFSPPPARRVASLWVAALGLMGLVAAGLAGWQHWRDQGVYRTAVGEQRLSLLDDGSRVHLNTGTELRVAIDARSRTVTMARGEALFEVAKDARPFVVRAEGSEVVALGTSFIVRLSADRSGASGAVGATGAIGAAEAAGRGLSVTLVEGQVSVKPAAGSTHPAYAPIVMQAGQRVYLPGVDAAPGAAASAAAALRVDRPPLEQLTAWKRSEVVFDGSTLADAIAEMNRYSRTPIVLVDAPQGPERRVSGVFRTGDSESFARAVGALHGLRVQHRDGRLELSAAA